LRELEAAFTQTRDQLRAFCQTSQPPEPCS
jgi:hypothetical protein